MDAIAFVPLLAGTWLIGFYALSTAGHYFTTIVEESATPQARRSSEKESDRVAWSLEGIIDWYWKGFYLAYLIAFALAPAFLIGSLLSNQPFLRTSIIAFLFAMIFPVCVLSSLATSRWNPFWPRLFWSFGQRPVQTLSFYLLSIPVMMAMLHLLNLMLFRPDVMKLRWALVLVPVVVLLFFLYARLLGRFGMVIAFTRTEAESVEDEEVEVKPERPRKRKASTKRPHENWGVPTEAHTEQPINAQPDTLPPLMTPYDGEITGYGVNFGNQPPPTPAFPSTPTRHHFDDEEEEPIVVAPPEPVAPSQRKANLAEPPAHLMKLYERPRLEEPDHPFGSEVFSFLFDPKTIESLFRLTVVLAVLVALQRALEALRPI